jgi:hypothetical protein
MRKWLRLEDFVFYAFMRLLENDNTRSIKLTKLMEYAHAIANKLGDATVLINRDLFYQFLYEYRDIFTEDIETNSLTLNENIGIYDLRPYNSMLSLDVLIAMSKEDVLIVLFN